MDGNNIHNLSYSLGSQYNFRPRENSVSAEATRFQQGKVLTKSHKGHCKIHSFPPLVCDREIADCEIRFLQQMERNLKIRIMEHRERGSSRQLPPSFFIVHLLPRMRLIVVPLRQDPTNSRSHCEPDTISQMFYSTRNAMADMAGYWKCGSTIQKILIFQYLHYIALDW